MTRTEKGVVEKGRKTKKKKRKETIRKHGTSLKVQGRSQRKSGEF